MNLPTSRTALDEIVARFPQFGRRSALLVDGVRLDYTDLHQRVIEVRALLADLGLGAGSRVALFMPNSVQFVVDLLAAWTAGMVVVPLNNRYRSDELAYVIEHADVQAVLTQDGAPGAPDLVARLDEALPGVGEGAEPGSWRTVVPLVDLVVVHQRDSQAAPVVVQDGVRAAPHQPAAAGSTELLLIYTSGTTSHPKGCVHDLDAFLTTARRTASTMGVEDGDVVWDPLPLFHTGGLLPLLGALDSGATFCTAAHFDAVEALELLEAERVTAAYPAFSTLLTALLDAPTFATTDLSSLRWVLAIGPQALLERVQRALPTATQVSCYGCTEMGGVAVYHRREDLAEVRATTAGRPFPGVEVDVVDPADGHPLPSGAAGEIVVRGPSVLRRYHRQEAPAVDADGWFHTGDLGSWSGDQLVFRGRLKDVFKVGGENVGAAEIEFVLVKHPAVTMAAAVALPDDRLGEVPAAFVELRPGASATATEIIDFCAARLASFKVPRTVHFVEQWPMSATKIQKFRLRDALLQNTGSS